MTVTTKATPVGEDGRPAPPPVQPPPVQANLPGPSPPQQGQEQLQMQEGQQQAGNDPNSSSTTSSVNSTLQESKEVVEGPNGDDSDVGALTDSGFGSKVVEDEAVDTVEDKEAEIEFPMAEMGRLDEMINRPRWVVPVLAKGELEVLLEASLDLCHKGLDTRCEGCQRFFRDGLTISFSKILTDEAVSGWKYEIQRCILKNTEKLIELCVLKLDEDWFPLLEMLAIAFNPSARFHMFNANRPSEHLPPSVAQPTSPTSPNAPSPVPEDESVFACSNELRVPKGWLCDLINLFGSLNGFEILVKRFERNLSVPIVAALIKPFGCCYEVLTTNTVKKYFTPIIDTVSEFLEKLTDDELKRDSKAEGKNDMLSVIINALKCLASRLPQQEQRIRELEMFRLNVILRLLQISSFNGKMNALNEVNKLIGNVTYNAHRHNQSEFDEWLTADKVAEWIEKNNVLSIVLRDSLHQPQYVEKLEKIIRFMIKEKALSLADLDKIWDAQTGKHEAIVKNVHDLLAKLAWDFSPQQLDHLFECFQGSWQNASKKPREKLLELIRRLAEDDKEGIMANKVLTLLWNLAQSDDVTTDIMDQALAAHIKILDYSSSQVCVQDRDSQKFDWISKFVEELNNDRLVIPALKQIREICQLFTEAPQNYAHVQRSSQMCYRNKVINNLHTNFSIVIRVANSLVEYMGKARKYVAEHPEADPMIYLPDGRFSHIQQVNERLRFLRFLLKDGQLWLCKPQVNEIWTCLAENAIYPADREHCFKWFSKLMGDEPDLDPDIMSEFFQQYVLKFDPALLTESGMICFERFFRQVNSKEGKLIPKRRGGYYMDDLNLIGIEYLWKVVSNGPQEVTEKAIILLKDIYTNLGPRLQSKQVEIHEDFLQDCMHRLKAMHDTVVLVLSEQNNDNEARMQQEAVRMIRILSVLRVYIAECDEGYVEERAILPLHRACRGKQITLIVRFPNQGRQAEDVEVWSHTNDTIASVRRQLVHRAKSGVLNLRAELYLNGEIIDTSHDRKLICALGIRDKTQLTAKLVQVGSNNPSSPESSSGSSTGSLHQLYDGPNIEAESCLPGVLMAHRLHYTEFLFSLTDLGTELGLPALREAANDILRLLPADAQTVERLRTLCADTVVQMGSTSAANSSPVGGNAHSAAAAAAAGNAAPVDSTATSSLEKLFFNSPSAKVLYYLEVTYALLMPAYGANTDENWEFQNNFMLSGGVSLCLKMITSPSFLASADLSTKRSAYLTVLKIAKLMLTAVGYAQVQVVAEACQGDGQGGNQVSPAQHNQAVLLQKALQCIPNTSSECVTRNTASKLGHCLSHQAIGVMPDCNTMRCLQKLAWASGGECLQHVHSTCEEIHKAFTLSATSAITEERQQMDSEDVSVCREALEVLTVSLALCPDAIDMMYKEKAWQNFIIGLLLTCRSRVVRISATEQFYLIATRTTGSHRIVIFFITLLFTVLASTAKDFASQSAEYFQLLCRLLSFSCASNIPLPTADSLLNNEIIWLKKIHDQVETTGSLQVDEALLDGHLGITKELVSLQTPAKKYQIGCESGGHNLIKELVEDFVFMSSKVLLVCRRQQGDIQQLDQRSVAVCSSPQTVMTCLELLVCLVTGSLPNLKYLAELITSMFYAGNEPVLTEWEYIPPVGPRPPKGFVGLKNAGATCYMNSVIQQLFMIDQIRDCILTAEGAADDSIEAEEMEEKTEAEPQVEFGEEDRMSRSGENENKNAQTGALLDERKEYHIKVLRYVQLIFAHLAYSKLQFYVPKGFWKHFRLQGEQLNLREQHDALEFFNSLVDSLDEALKAFGYKPMLTKVLGGSFADQKICKGCPHRYSREEPFTALNIDIRNHQNLVDSLDQYVKGDLLEGANAYHCEKCNKKVDTVKRLCIKKLPPILAIQLKRFDYDWERECAIKFNDYFEFPRDLDMAPFTVQGLASIEGEAITDENEDGEKESENMNMNSTKYRLVGVVVHSGQASGGHYYSYILHRYGDEPPRWYKFDDGEVSECKMEDDEEMKNQCFGGEYMGEVFDHMLKRMSYRRQKRWWNAYILFYEQVDQPVESDTEEKLVKTLYDLTIGDQDAPRMPAPVERCVRKQNIQYLHNKNQFCPEYFRFMRRLLVCNSYTGQLPAGDDKMSSEAEELSMISVQLVSTFLFNVGFHTKKTLRGAAGDWYEALAMHLRHSRTVRNWFIQNVLFSHSGRVAEYLLECPSTEVRNAFMRLVVFIAHFSLQDGPCPPQLSTVIGISNEPKLTASDHILMAIIQLLKKDVSEHGRHLSQYFNLFQTYANLGLPEKQQLLNLQVPEQLMAVTMDDGSIPSIKYQYAELNKLYTVVSQLVRCCDVSARCKSSIPGRPVAPNPYGEVSLKVPLMKIQSSVAEMLFERPNYVKKLIQDCNNFEETTKLLRFCCWENPHFSVTVLNELLWQVAYSCTYELKPYLDLLLQTLKLEDSWQNHRIHNALKGIPDERDGLFDTIHISRTQYQKRAYQCIKMMVLLFSECQTAAELLSKQIDLKRKFTSAVEWLHDELERRPYPGNPQYTYNNWSAQAQSNETSNGYFLERSNSAKLTLAKALELCPEEEVDEVEMSVVEDNGSHSGVGGVGVGGGSGVVCTDESTSPGSGVSTGQPVELSGAPGSQDSDTPSSSQGPSSANSTTTLTDAGADIPLVPGTTLVTQVSDVSPPLSPVRSQPIGQALVGGVAVEEFNANINVSNSTVETASTETADSVVSVDGSTGDGNSVNSGISVVGKEKN